MRKVLDALHSNNEIDDYREFIFLLCNRAGGYLLRNDILLEFQKFCEDQGKSPEYMRTSVTAGFLGKIPEMIIQEEGLAVMYRHAIARYRFFRLHMDGEGFEEITVSEFLSVRDAYVGGRQSGTPLTIDFMPFHESTPAIKDSRSLGNGIRYLNKYLSSSIFQNPRVWNEKLFEFLRLHSVAGEQLLVNDTIIKDYETFIVELDSMMGRLGARRPEDPWETVAPEMKRSGFEAGWGNTVARILETMQLLVDLLNEPDDGLLARFISRIPMITNVAVISPHGWFGQEHVLGRPDTGGQVIYILDQVRALEKHIRQELLLAGIDVAPKILVLTRLIPDADRTTCDQPLEKIFNTENSYILRVPFRDGGNSVLEHWISRFHLWPYLDAFADEAYGALRSEFQGRPDLIIGNYSDGNLVATILSDRFNVTQCTIAHALEKTKYLFSDLYWREMEANYHFSLQFTADMIAMNKSDFIVTSTYQEIAGTEETMGQYESYQFFTMPGLYRVTGGVNLFHPKFNVIPPGVDADNYFPFRQRKRRIKGKTSFLRGRLFKAQDDDIFGTLADPDKMPIFTMARFDRIKNITGLIEAFGMSDSLKERCNLLFAAGTIHLHESLDEEEREEIRKAYGLIDRYNLHGSIRWLPSIGKMDTGEVYRIIADRRGIFVQPALFEAFGLTILEAMVSGLPTVATRFGGPQEIIQDGVNGFLVNTSMPALISRRLEEVVDLLAGGDGLWEKISEAGIERVQSSFTWDLYSAKLIDLTKLYGFWRFSEREQHSRKMNLYCDIIYHFLFRERARAMGQG
ncbi:MAG TPA: sucrose synthase [Spirochaetes bacterium]|nr:sucrose synthase [Spirochaetota bacterium]